MKFAANPVQTQTPKFIDMGFLNVNALDESSGRSNPVNINQRPKYGSHWRAPDHGFGEATAVVMSGAKSDHDYNSKTEFQIWKDNKKFKHQNMLVGRPFWFYTPIGTSTTNTKITFGIDSCWYANNIPQATNTTNRIVKTQKSGKIVRTRGV